MALQVGIVGLPNVGKSTLFNALTRAGALAANYPFATIEPNTGVVPVPDARLPVLARLSSSERQVAAAVTFTDIAGLVRGAAGGAGLGNQFLAHIREADAVAMVVRAFEDPDVVHVDGRVDPASDVETVLTELALADLQTLERSQKRLEAEAKRDPKAGRAVLEAAQRAREHLEAGTALFQTDLRGAPELHELFLLTDKPVLYVFNVDEEQLGEARPARAADRLGRAPAPCRRALRVGGVRAGGDGRRVGRRDARSRTGWSPPGWTGSRRSPSTGWACRRT